MEELLGLAFRKHLQLPLGMIVHDAREDGLAVGALVAVTSVVDVPIFQADETAAVRRIGAGLRVGRSVEMPILFGNLPPLPISVASRATPLVIDDEVRRIGHRKHWSHPKS